MVRDLGNGDQWSSPNVNTQVAKNYSRTRLTAHAAVPAESPTAGAASLLLFPTIQCGLILVSRLHVSAATIWI